MLVHVTDADEDTDNEEEVCHIIHNHDYIILYLILFLSLIVIFYWSSAITGNVYWTGGTEFVFDSKQSRDRRDTGGNETQQN